MSDKPSGSHQKPQISADNQSVIRTHLYSKMCQEQIKGKYSKYKDLLKYITVAMSWQKF